MRTLHSQRAMLRDRGAQLRIFFYSLQDGLDRLRDEHPSSVPNYQGRADIVVHVCSAGYAAAGALCCAAQNLRAVLPASAGCVQRPNGPEPGLFWLLRHGANRAAGVGMVQNLPGEYHTAPLAAHSVEDSVRDPSSDLRLLTLRLAPLLPTTVASVQFPDVKAAVEASIEILRSGVAGNIRTS
ncbi:FAD-binding protein [Mycena sanguinolenta]|uniref:FAD-binding protein n=1 Tax=Mycena sanguinolenta TaxID=230812 RepID=A0A8H6ZDJ9_9AGAR|nr:FAD-binding protein [Mycena sanguinolenta]